MSAERICLGTAQFGMNYGISNTRGQVSEREVATMLTVASAAGVAYLDTARAYGTSEEVIGRALAASADFRIITKSTASNGQELQHSLSISKRALTRPIYGLLSHDVGLLLSNPALWQEFEAAERSGAVTKIGVSVNRADELSQLDALSIKPQIIQAPVSVFDQRFVNPLRVALDRGVEIFVRSSFLQGAAFLDPHRLPPALEGLREKLLLLRQISAREALPIAALCLRFVQGVLPEAKVVVGATSTEELQTNLDAVSGGPLTPGLLAELASLRVDDERIVMPSNWS